MSEKLKVLELFSGIGACSKALERLGIDHEIVDSVEIDKYAVKSFNAVHGTNFEPQDITKWDKDIKVDLIMHGSPCQDFSVAGKGAGGDKDSGTRSSLMYETLRIVEKLKPKYVIWENVKNLLSKKHIHNFNAYLEAMEKLGYKNFYKVLNAKDYGIPQNRERVFTCSFLDNTVEYEFPNPMPLERKLKDMLDEVVDEKYYLSDRQMEGMMNTHFNSYSIKALKCHPQQLGVCVDDAYCVASRGRGEKGSIEQHFEPRFDGATNTLTSVQKDNYVAIKTANKQGYDLATDGDGIDLAYPNSTTRRGRVGHEVSKTLACSDTMGVITKSGSVKSKIAEINKSAKHQQNLVQDSEGLCRTIPAGTHGSTPHLLKTIVEQENLQFRIRKLTPKECWRLMGFDDSDFERAEKVNSNTQLYKQAGNSIVVNVLEGILKNLLENDYGR